MQKLTKEQAIVITGFTGIVACSFADFHVDVERRLGRSVFTHEFATNTFKEEVKDLYYKDFLSMLEGV